jgi:hypothetical protein
MDTGNQQHNCTPTADRLTTCRSGNGSSTSHWLCFKKKPTTDIQLILDQQQYLLSTVVVIMLMSGFIVQYIYCVYNIGLLYSV